MQNADLSLTPEQQKSLENHGLSLAEIRRQWSLLTENPRRLLLDRPCTIGDGIVRLSASQHQPLIDLHQQAAAKGRWQKFVPASGAASRMFALTTSADRIKFCESINKFAFAPQLKKVLEANGVNLQHGEPADHFDKISHALLADEGLGYGQSPKGLLDFHRYGEHAGTAFNEHLREAAGCLADNSGGIKAHFTVGEDSRSAFAAELERIAADWGAGNVDVDFSVQRPATDTIAMDHNGKLLMDAGNSPVLRPGGHGALIENLNALAGDLVFVKNIDNITHEHARADSLTWIQILGGYLLQLQDSIHHHLQRLQQEDEAAVTQAAEFVQQHFPGASKALTTDGIALRTALLQRLNRPLRVCGMVKNEGEPGGGPFWTAAPGGDVSPQIVESAELDSGDAGQQAIFAQGTHFNPVFMGLSLRNASGEPFDLTQFIDQSRFIKATKPYGGQTATVLERPGLWNGAMAGWNTVFIEVPTSVFSPAKTVLDLLRAEHQPA